LSNTTNAGKFRSNIRFYYTAPVPIDLATSALNSPSLPISANSNQQVTIELFNTGTVAVISAAINYRLNGGAIVTENWAGNLAPTDAVSVGFITPVQIPASPNSQLLQLWI